MQDVLGLGANARMNTPGVSAGNWTWRITDEALNHPGKDALLHITRLFQRHPEQQQRLCYTILDAARSESGKFDDGFKLMDQRSVFFEEWLRSLREQYKHVVRTDDQLTLRSLTAVMHNVEFGEAELTQLRLEATMHVDDVGTDYVADVSNHGKSARRAASSRRMRLSTVHD